MRVDTADSGRPPVRRWLLYALAAVVALDLLVVGVIQLTGGDIGAPCADSYSCRGFLVGGAECVAVDRGAYCTRYCDTDDQCPDGWACLGANPTVLTVETRTVDEVCVRPSRP